VALTVCGLIGGSVRTTCAERPDTPGGLAFASGVPRYDQAYRKARQVIASDVKDGNFLLDAEPRAVPLVEAALQGTHQVEIRLGGIEE
jgi:hypothetical protein